VTSGIETPFARAPLMVPLLLEEASDEENERAAVFLACEERSVRRDAQTRSHQAPVTLQEARPATTGAARCYGFATQATRCGRILTSWRGVYRRQVCLCNNQLF
jgi:hypothetical protein